MSDIVRIMKYGVEVSTDLEYDNSRARLCLCFRCDSFKPDDAERNCRIAQLLYAVCRETGIAAGVSRCPIFIPKTPEPEK